MDIIRSADYTGIWPVIISGFRGNALNMQKNAASVSAKTFNDAGANNGNQSLHSLHLRAFVSRVSHLNAFEGLKTFDSSCLEGAPPPLAPAGNSIPCAPCDS